MFRIGDRVAYRASRIGDDYLVVGCVISVLSPARFGVLWDVGGYDELAVDALVAEPVDVLAVR